MIANHLIRHEVHHQVTRRRVALMPGTQFPEELLPQGIAFWVQPTARSFIPF